MTKKQETIATYEKSAEALAKKFDVIGVRADDISYVFSFSEKPSPFVLEIGCGNGRDAQEIIRHTNKYLGLDVSANLLSIAKKNNPGVSFIQADIETYAPPQGIDIVFAFASLIHVPRDSFKEIMARLYDTLTTGGLVFVSLKYAKEYEEVTKTDEFGTRTYYHYSQVDTVATAPQFTVLHITIQEAVGQMWIDVLYRKD